jgi:hypothetical protein
VAETPTIGATPIAGTPLSIVSNDEKIPETQLSLTTSQIKEIHRKAGVSSSMLMATPTATAGTSKTIQDTISVLREHQNGGKNKDDLTGFAPSDRMMRTPPQQLALITPLGGPMRTPPQSLAQPLPPGAPSRPTQSGTMNPQDFGSPSKMMEPANLIQILQAAKDLADSVTSAGRNSTIKKDLLTTIDSAIVMAVKEEQEKNKLAEPDHQHEDYSCKHGSNNEINELRKEINDLKGAFRELQETLKVTIMKPESFAQIVKDQEMDASKISLEMAKRERIEKNMKKREKMEVVLTLRNASKDVQQELEALKESAIAETLQEAICDWLTTTGKKDIKIKRAEKVSKNILKLQCATEEDAEVIQGLEWAKILKGAAISKKPRGVVMHGVSKRHINFETQSQDEIRTKINEENDIKVLQVMPLMKRVKNPDAPTQSIVILMEDPSEANYCIDNGVDFRIDNGVEIKKRNYHAERYMPECQVKQCYNCQGFGHMAFICTKAPKCRKCAGDHESRKCNKDSKEPPQCVNCTGSHDAGNHKECPRAQKERERQASRRDMTPTSFAC